MSNAEKITVSMMLVKACLQSGDAMPSWYRADDRDMGYRSALRHHKIQRTNETDALATALIHNTKPELSTVRECQLSLF